jgi:hemerythrin-like domain-containing protein
MLRDKSLIPLSHQHQHALALCVRIERAQPIPASQMEAWQIEIEQHFTHEIKVHFSAEEHVLFPVARQFSELVALVEELSAEHGELRHAFAEAGARRMSSASLPVFAQRLSEHIRKEERQLFERLQNLMNPEELSLVGTRLEQALKDAHQFCSTSETAVLRPAKKSDL